MWGVSSAKRKKKKVSWIQREDVKLVCPKSRDCNLGIWGLDNRFW